MVIFASGCSRDFHLGFDEIVILSIIIFLAVQNYLLSDLRTLHDQCLPSSSSTSLRFLLMPFRCVTRASLVAQCRRPGVDPWVRKIPWRRKWQPTPVLLPGEFHGLRSLVGYSPWGRKESDMTDN